MRRLPAILLVAAVAAAVVWTLWGRDLQRSTPANAWRAIPPTASAVLEVPLAATTWDRWTHTAALWATLSSTTTGVVLDSLFTRLHRSLEAAGTRATQDPTVLAAWVRTGGRTAGLLVVCAVGSAEDERMLGDILRLDGSSLDRLRRGEMLPVPSVTADLTLHLSLREGLLLVATDPATLEASLLRLADPAPLDPALLQARGTFGTGVDAHLLIQLPVAEGLLGAHLLPLVADAMHWPSGMAALDVRVRPEALLMSGVLVGAQGEGTQREDALQPFVIPRVLPEAVHVMSAKHVAPDSLRAEGSGTILLEGPYVKGTWHRNDTACVAGVWRTRDGAAVSEALRALRRADNTCDSLDHRGVTLYRPSHTGHLRTWLGVNDTGMDRPWCALYGEKFVLCPEATWLREAIDAWMDGTSLAEDGRTAAFLQQHGIAAETSWWCDVARSRTMLYGWADTTLRRTLTSADNTLGGLGGFLLQTGTDALGNPLISVCLQAATQAEVPSSALWTTDLGNPPIAGPFPVRNHVNNSREVLVQDERAQLYLVGGTGQVLWSRELSSPILGEVHQVDRFRNGKLQYLFNTNAQVFLIDRNGKDVDGFPVPAQTTAPLAVFDYENTREYRILLPLSDGRILNLGLDGKATQGWNAPTLGVPCHTAVRHLRTGTQDHLLLLPENGQPLVIDRRGSARTGVSATLPAWRELLGVQAGASLDAIAVTWADTLGAVHRTRLDGTTTTLAPAGSITSTALLTDLDNDARPEVLGTRGDSLLAWADGSLRLLRVFGTPVRLLPAHIRPVQGLFLSAPDRDRTHLVDAGGRDQPGSPFTGGHAAALWPGGRGEGYDLVTLGRNGRLIAWKLHGR